MRLYRPNKQGTYRKKQAWGDLRFDPRLLQVWQQMVESFNCLETFRKLTELTTIHRNLQHPNLKLTLVDKIDKLEHSDFSEEW